jgi:hypothetical protein
MQIKIGKMTSNNLKYILFALCTSLLFIQCADDDDNGNVISQITCNDGIQNGDEEGIDCGGSACEPCITDIDFTGTFVQLDIVGRPAINTVFSGTDMVKNNFNVSEVSNRSSYQPIFETTLEAYHDVYAAALGIPLEDLNYESNIFDLDATTFTTVLAQFDALQVSPSGQTTYYDSASGLALTGRNLSDDVIDISLTLMFGGSDGTRFDGSDTNGDGNPDTPQLTSDGVGPGDRDFSLSFPYLEMVVLPED